MSDQKIAVHVLENGPLKISGDDLSVAFCGEPIAVEEGKDVYLCRCGLSDNAPFCDGSHAREGFVAEPASAGKKAIKIWEGNTIRTQFNPNVCMHVFHCKPLKELRERELAGDSDAADEIARVVLSCPSGALAYESKTAATPALGDGPAVDVVEGGEVRICRDFEINVPLQELQTGDRATLCRCGDSQNKPWCDGRHRKRKDFR